MKNMIVLPAFYTCVLTVGGQDADVSGFDSRSVQTAIDALKIRGGGTVLLNEGIYEISAPIRLGSNITLSGKGTGTVLRKTCGYKSRFVEDADYGELSITVEDAGGFRTGMGIMVYDSDHRGDWQVTTAVITSIDKNTIYFDNYLLADYDTDKCGMVSGSCSVIEGIEVRGVRITDLAIDGGKATNEYINGCRGGAVYIHKSENCTVENVTITDFNGDGISWQIDTGVTVRNCDVSGCTGFGIHPGTGSLDTVVEGCNIHDNGSDGLFVCWRVRNGLFRDNEIHNNGQCGINIGHKDTDNLFESNHIYGNNSHGILMREEENRNGAHRNTYRKNIIENNGDGEKGCGILIDSYTEGVCIEDNIIRDTGKNVQKMGILINSAIPDSKIQGNKIYGHPDDYMADNGNSISK